jgi:hypothetical protein
VPNAAWWRNWYCSHINRRNVKISLQETQQNCSSICWKSFNLGIHAAKSKYNTLMTWKAPAAISRLGSGSQLMAYVNADNQSLHSGWKTDDLQFEITPLTVPLSLNKRNRRLFYGTFMTLNISRPRYFLDVLRLPNTLALLCDCGS